MACVMLSYLSEIRLHKNFEIFSAKMAEIMLSRYCSVFDPKRLHNIDKLPKFDKSKFMYKKFKQYHLQFYLADLTNVTRFYIFLVNCFPIVKFE